MAFEGMNAYSNGMGPNQLPRFTGSQGSANVFSKGLDIPGFRVPNSQTSGQSFMGSWGDHALQLSERDLEAQAGNAAGKHIENRFNPPTSPPKSIEEGGSKALVKTGQSPSSAVPPPVIGKSTLSYTDLMHLRDSGGMKKTEVNWDTYKNKVTQNFAGTREAVQNGTLFKGVTPGDYFKKTVWGENVRPIKNMVTSGTDYGSGGVRLLGLGTIVATVGGKTSESFHNAKAKGDSNLQAGIQAAGTFAGQTVKSLTGWEVGLAAYAVGKAALPFKTKLPFGDIKLAIPALIFAGLAEAAAYKVMDKVIPDPE
jgi:hypothetical protein